MNKDVKVIIGRILNDLRVELGDEFNRNFERQAFFSEAWTRRRSPTRPGGHILVDSGELRRSIQSRTTENSITFYTTLPYAAIHNDGGEIVVTAKMKRFSGRNTMPPPELSDAKRTAAPARTNVPSSYRQRRSSGKCWRS